MGLVPELKSSGGTTSTSSTPSTTSGNAASNGAGAAPSADALRAMTYAQGRRALSPQRPGRGSALVTGASQTTEEAHNDGFTARLIETLQKTPAASLDDAVAVARAKVANQYSDQHVTTTTVDDHGARARGGARRRAVFLANAHYKDKTRFGSLEETLGEATALEGALFSKGYSTLGVRRDQTAAQMKTAAEGAMLGNGATPGDHVVVHYGGHGVHSGLVGVSLDGARLSRYDRAPGRPTATITYRPDVRDAHVLRRTVIRTARGRIVVAATEQARMEGVEPRRREPSREAGAPLDSRSGGHAATRHPSAPPRLARSPPPPRRALAQRDSFGHRPGDERRAHRRKAVGTPG